MTWPKVNPRTGDSYNRDPDRWDSDRRDRDGMVGLVGTGSMDLTERQRFVVQTTETRERALRTLCALEAARDECEGHLASSNREDVMKRLTGESSMEKAIASARRVIECLDRALLEARRALDPSERAAIETRAPAPVGSA